VARIPSKSGSLKDVTKFTKLARLRSLGSRGSARITDADLLGASSGHGIKLSIAEVPFDFRGHRAPAVA